ncbi:prepilin peptidase [Aerococcus agrisoli]|uniref:Prepilin peptidase n=1 Tax=Aerococcus agrisoli TaxID=2487350 RepID=A0A3N4GHH5_9LACT|nr:A24 family peptidase [Aerococcus agrisoli]RPA60887.1 prepilin peptidase [Aerococcus agrisoli]
MLYILYYTILGLLFACLASFFMVVGARTVQNQSFIMGRSHCDHCQRPIPPLALIPILGYLLSNGRCQSCQHSIPIKYPICEAYFAIFSLILFMTFSLSESVFYIIYFAILTIMAASDWSDQWIPDRFQVLLLLFVIGQFSLNPSGRILTHSLFAVGICLLFILLNFRFTNGIGGGDIKTITILALALGPYQTAWLLFVATSFILCHIIIDKYRGRPLAKGFPFLPYIFFAYPLIFYIL